MYLKTIFDQFVVILQVLKPTFSIWAIMAHTRVIMSFQSSYGIGLIVGALKCVKMIYGLFH